MSAVYRNWSSSVVFRPAEILLPNSEAEVRDIVLRCVAEGKRLRVVGSAHSFTALIETEQVLVSLDNLQGLIQADKEALTAEVWAGTKLKALGEILHKEGMGMENLGDIDVQSIAGALSTGTHGTGVDFGTLATQLLEVTFVAASGEIITCSETLNPEYFQAARISLGALGVITRLKLRLKPAYKLKYASKKQKLREVLDQLDAYKSRNRNFEFYWFPFTDTVQTKEMNLTDEAAKPGGIGQWFNDIFMENGVFWLLSKISRFIPGTSKAVSRISAWGISTGTSVAWSHQVFATPRYVRFQEMEYNLPQEHFRDALLEIQALIDEKQFRVHFPLECRFVAADDIWISPAYGRKSAYIAVHMYKGMKYKEYFDAIEAVLKKYDGRPHWGKMHNMTAEECAERYPKWQDFQRVRQQLDPKGMFMNPYLERLFGA